MPYLLCYRSPPSECAYFPERQMVALVADVSLGLTKEDFSDMMRMGFRRQGRTIYRPHCDSCAACVSVRVPVLQFSPSRTQRKTWRKNQDLQAQFVAKAMSNEQFELFKRYQQSRHAKDNYSSFELEKWYRVLITETETVTHVVEFRDEGGRLMLVSVIDELDHGLSALYTFYDPDFPARSLGTFAILWQIDLATRWQLDYVYLGYWIRDCANMRYKDRFQPLEYWQGLRWSAEPCAES